MKKILFILSVVLLGQAATDFSIVYIPDTQNWTRVPERRIKFIGLTKWVVANRDSLNIIFVSHVGDMVCRDEASAEFTAAKDAMDILGSAGIPYGIAPGNHDGNMEQENGEFYNYNKYFPITTFEDNPWFGGNFPEGQTNNIYFTLSHQGIKLLFLHVVDHSYYPGRAYIDDGRNWAKGVIESHPDHKILITTHAYMSSNTSLISGGRVIWDELIYPSSNVVMLVCGHIVGEAYRVDKTQSGQSVIQILTNWQSYNNETWDGAFRLLEFDLTANEMTSSVFNSWLEIYPPCGQGGNFTYKNPLGDISVPIQLITSKSIKNITSKAYVIYDMKGRVIPHEEFTNQKLTGGSKSFQIYIIQFKDGRKISVYKKVFGTRAFFSHL